MRQAIREAPDLSAPVWIMSDPMWVSQWPGLIHLDQVGALADLHILRWSAPNPNGSSRGTTDEVGARPDGGRGSPKAIAIG